MSANKGPRMSQLSNAERLLNSSNGLAKAKSIVPKRKRIDKDDDEKEEQKETWHSFESA